MVPIKARDTWWTALVVDPFATPTVARLSRFRWVTPDRLTFLSVSVGVVAAAMFATGHFLAGAFVYQLSFFIDCMDGKLAGIRGPRHSWGAYIDVMGDSLRFISCSAGLAVGLIGEGFDGTWEVGVFVLYPSVRWATIALGDARPAAPNRGRIEVAPHPIAVLRVAPGRLGYPGSTVDTETVAFTVAPLVGFPFVGVIAATIGDLLHLLALYVLGLRSARQEERMAA